MKTSIATTLSVVGVLAAGGVAFAVNTSVLDTATNQFSASQALEANIADIATGDSGAAISEEQANPVSGQSATDTIAPATKAEAPSATAVETSYNIAGIGVVTLSHNGSALSVANVAPVSGYTFTSMNESASRIEVIFKNGTKTLKFHADIIGDRIITSVLNEPTDPSGAPRMKHRGEDHDDDHDGNHEEGEDDDD
jgi:hypothetical protein